MLKFRTMKGSPESSGHNHGHGCSRRSRAATRCWRTEAERQRPRQRQRQRRSNAERERAERQRQRWRRHGDGDRTRPPTQSASIGGGGPAHADRPHPAPLLAGRASPADQRLAGRYVLIGPRPELGTFVRLFEEAVHRYGDRHRVKSGITGWAQVHGLRGNTSLADRVEWDNYYIENWSLWLDMKIAVMTVGCSPRWRED